MSFTKRLWDKMRQSSLAENSHEDDDYFYNQWMEQERPVLMISETTQHKPINSTQCQSSQQTQGETLK